MPKTRACYYYTISYYDLKIEVGQTNGNDKQQKNNNEGSMVIVKLNYISSSTLRYNRSKAWIIPVRIV
uniref:Uncharacterized protein n=1 Tax=Romanomermis culicivorax TaxID=13658 RepID=A0A915J9B7_ROMCU